MKKWIDTLEEHIVKWLIGVFLTSIGVAVTFYFNASHTMAQNTVKIEEVKQEVKKISNTPELNTLKINQLSVELLDQKGILKDFQGQYNRDKEIIIQLLLDIKKTNEGNNR
jgi:uncharacterized membrane protein